jgi:acyl carrier protein
MSSVSNLSQFQSDAIEMISDLTSDWDTGLEALTPQTAIVADLGFESLDVVYLVTAIEQRYGRRDLPFDQLLMIQGRYVDDLTIDQIAVFLQKYLS